MTPTPRLPFLLPLVVTTAPTRHSQHPLLRICETHQHRLRVSIFVTFVVVFQRAVLSCVAATEICAAEVEFPASVFASGFFAGVGRDVDGTATTGTLADDTAVWAAFPPGGFRVRPGLRGRATHEVILSYGRVRVNGEYRSAFSGLSGTLAHSWPAAHETLLHLVVFAGEEFLEVWVLVGF